MAGFFVATLGGIWFLIVIAAMFGKRQESADH